MNVATVPAAHSTAIHNPDCNIDAPEALVVVAAVAAGVVELATVATVVLAVVAPVVTAAGTRSGSLLKEAETPELLLHAEGRVETLPATNFTTEHYFSQVSKMGNCWVKLRNWHTW